MTPANGSAKTGENKVFLGCGAPSQFLQWGSGGGPSFLLPSEAWRPQQGTERPQSSLGKRALAGGSLMGPKGCLDMSSLISRLLFSVSAAKTHQPTSSLSCSPFRFGILNGSTYRIRWYRHVSWGATSLDCGMEMGDIKEVGKMIVNWTNPC